MINEISKAMDAHTLWRTRLELAIENSEIDVPLEIIKTDNNCAFGKWLYGDKITGEIKNSSTYKEVLNLHAKFHQEAHKVADFALQGKKADAIALLDMHGTYNETSKALMQLLIKWRKDLI